MKVGEIYKFDYINGHTRDLNRRFCVYMCEDFIVHPNGATVENHKVLMFGESNPRTIDGHLLRWMREVEQC